MSDHIEIETKYDVPDDFRLPALEDLPPGGVETRSHSLAATYFDTDDLRLAVRGITLRRRTGGTDDGWHLKLPWGPDARREFHAPLGEAVDRVPSALSALVTGVTLGAALRPVARLRTTRIEHALGTSPGVPPAVLVADDTVTGENLVSAHGSIELLSWREIEIELGAGGGADARAAAVRDRLTEAGARPAESGSKLLRVLGDRVPAPEQPRTDGGAGPVRRYLWDQADTLLSYDPLVRVAEEDAVHQMRVAARKLRTTLRAFPSVVDRDAARPLTEELRWLGARLSRMRDLEVLRERFVARIDALPETVAGVRTSDAWLSVVDEQILREQAKIGRTLVGERYLALLAEVARLRSEPPLVQGADRVSAKALGADVRSAWRRLKRRHRTARRTDADPADPVWHEARKAAKRVRYAARVARPALGKPAKRVERSAKRMQTALGEHHDGIAAREYLAAHSVRLLRRSPGDRDRTLATLAAVDVAERDDGPARLADFAELWTHRPRRRELRRLGRK